MPPATEHTHHLKIRNHSTQLEMNPGPAAGARQGEDVEGKLRAAQVQLEQLQHQRESLERERLEVETLNTRKREFISAQTELTERLASTVQRIEREIYELKEHTADLDQARACFAAHLAKLEKINPDGWSREHLAAGLERAMAIADHADDEFAQAAEHYSRTRSSNLFNGSKARRMVSGDFARQFRNGLAYNLPVIILGSIALIVYLVK
ncbi:ELKS/Rab6-interacting/CAST family protein [Luteolibacter flavescens]|uniref:ELKS/Rab6-interacting/CAST family protein n=1 Tax=Luteolibacter flavescens TaxID=1859460 RepID=A0ABT3FLN3_9BACT|nr:ELKS/Rab6-interacting/CAST family protein [Luteolibacter flavescens]MCW1884480.1 ELKS/Rab6-interacting/CAST family protein [Luteolibacter flavescens]